MMKGSCKLALDIGGRSIKSGLIQDDIVIGCEEMAVDSQGSAQSVLHTFQTVVLNNLQAAAKNHLTIDGIGVSVPGPFDYSRGASLMRHKYPAIYGVPLRNVLLEPVGNIPLRFLPDTGAFLMGALDVLQPTADNVCAITIGTGIGFAGVLNGQLQYGANGGPMLQLFTMPYLDGCVEDYVSKRALERRYCELGGNVMSVKDMAQLARCNDPVAKRLFAQVGSDLMHISIPILRSYGFTCLIIGGQIARACDLMLPVMQQIMSERDDHYEILLAGEIAQAALLGAAKAV